MVSEKEIMEYSILSIYLTLIVLILRVSEKLGVILMKGHSTFTKALKKEPHHLMV